MNINSLLRELSGPRPLCRDPDIVSKPRIWKHSASAVSLESQSTLRDMRAGRMATPPTSIAPHTDLALMLDSPDLLVYAMWKFSNIKQ
jgi:hypothetical protein